MYSHSSSSSSSILGSEPASRATTPSSDVSLPNELETIRSPKCCVHLVSTVKPTVLSAIFDKHAVGGVLGVCFPGSSTPNITLPVLPDLQDEWVSESIGVDGLSDRYLIVEATQGVIDSRNLEAIMATDPIQGSHLTTIAAASLRSIISFAAGDRSFVLHVVERPTFIFPPRAIVKSLCSSSNIPLLEEWRNLWSAWDLVTLRMIPQEMLHQKPIDLRHKCLFYIGHIPTFLDMLLSKAIGGGASEPQYFWNIFERGIDPHVDDPDHCHRHSEVPETDEDWPRLETIIGFRNRVRARLVQLYEELQTGERRLTRNIARTLVMTLEHESFHIETLLYMLIQRAGSGTLPPPGFYIPPWELLVKQWSAIPRPSTPSVILGPETIVLGHDDCEGEDKREDKMFDVDGHTYGWDNESPIRHVAVGRFRVEWRPISNGEFEEFWRKNDNVPIPKSWCLENGDLKVRTLYGLVPMDTARDWPVLTSYDDLTSYARSKGGRLPTEPELRLFLDKYDVGFEGGANTGFRNWHPTPATMGLDQYQGRGSNGGVWEWTSTVFDTHEGLSPTNLFTGYSTDFFDTKHQVVLGASYATIPRLCRRTLRNFYQHNYPYPWVSARVVYNV